MKLIPYNLFFLWLIALSISPQGTKCQIITADRGYILESEKDIMQIDSLHFGGGTAIGYSFFQDFERLKFIFRKRVLTPGSAIHYHLQKEDEIYYILSGKGEMKMNDEVFEVSSGSAVLTLAGSSHGLKPTGDEDLVIIIVYENDAGQ